MDATASTPAPPARRMAWSCQAASGQAMVIFALASLVLIGMLALSVDAGYLLSERRQTQSAADSAALAAAQALLDGKSSAEVQATGKSYGALNADVAESDVTVTPTTSTTAYTGRYSVTVSIKKDVTRFFVGAIYSGDWSVSASARADADTTPGDYALITLNDAEPGIYMNGNTTIKLRGDKSSAMSNSNITGNGGPDFIVEGSIDAHAGISGGGGWTAPLGQHGGYPQIDDPIETAGITTPWSPAAADFPDCGSGCIVSPGHYKDVNVTVQGVITLLPGQYYFENSYIGLRNTNSKFIAKGVQIYWDETSTFDPKNGDVYVTVDPLYPVANPNRDPADPKEAIVFWYTNCDEELDMQGNGNLFVQGIFYAPCTVTKMHGNPAGDTLDGQVIVGQLNIKGTSDFGVKYSKFVDTTRPKIYLVE